MLIEAELRNRSREHTVSLTTNGKAHTVSIPPKAGGMGSSANGGELLCLALATCYRNDIYREAEQRGIAVTQVKVRAQAELGSAGEPARSLSYWATVAAPASERDIRELMLHTDKVAEIHNTLRRGMEVRLVEADAKSEY